MKLIDILVRELPKRGGWPQGAIECQRFVDEATIDFYDKAGNFTVDCSSTYGAIAAELCREPIYPCENEKVTVEQYESALAASKSEWGGEGLPPIGVVAEVSVDGGRSWCSYKALSESNGMRLVEIGDFTEEFQANNYSFRPMRSEADKKREKGVVALATADPKVVQFTCGEKMSNGELIGSAWYDLYDAIAAGKVPGIRID